MQAAGRGGPGRGGPGRGGPTNLEGFAALESGLKITGMKVFGVSLTPNSDRPYVFVKLETNQGLIGWGEGTLEGKAGAVMACVNDFKDFLIGSDPMQVEHIWQSMYVHSFYRSGPVMGSAISGIDQALWDIRGKALGMPVYKLLGGPFDTRGVRGYYHVDGAGRDQLVQLRETARQIGLTCVKAGIPGYYEWLERRPKVDRAIKSIQMMREALGPDIDIAIDFHAKTSPSVASVIVKEVEALNLLFIEEPCPPENVEAMAKIARRSTTPIATGERLITHYGCREVIERGVVDILQTDINHVGGLTALWKVAANAHVSGISMAPHACEGPIGGLATIHVDAAMPNFVVQEICGQVTPGTADKIWEEWFGFPAMRMVNGRFPLSEKPGLGFELSEASLAKFPFGGTRPMARVFHDDGSVAEW
ncbi:MAG: galactonate dehydratase [Bryobacterales bacterium]|nr:galactonate dehydratase [Bryobacterales bacterium]